MSTEDKMNKLAEMRKNWESDENNKGEFDRQAALRQIEGDWAAASRGPAPPMMTSPTGEVGGYTPQPYSSEEGGYTPRVYSSREAAEADPNLGPGVRFKIAGSDELWWF